MLNHEKVTVNVKKVIYDINGVKQVENTEKSASIGLYTIENDVAVPFGEKKTVKGGSTESWTDIELMNNDEVITLYICEDDMPGYKCPPL